MDSKMVGTSGSNLENSDVENNSKQQETNFQHGDKESGSSWETSTFIDEYDEEESFSRGKGAYFHIPYGFQSRGCYRHASKNCEIGGVTRYLNYPAYQFNVLRLIIFSWKFNVYFALSKEYALKVFNLNFHEVISVSAAMHSVLCMVFNPIRDELITGGTGGMKFWTFGEVTTDRRRAWDKDSRPMANYGLVLRASYPKMGGSWVKQVELDTVMQRLYCLSERNVVAYDMMGNELFQVRDAHRGPVTGCVYSKSCNLLVTAGNDCDVNVWSRTGGKVHTFSSHTKVITKIMLHPEASGMVITASIDGMVKVFSLDVMEEIYSLPVFPEGIYWMECVSSWIIYCCSNRQIEVFALNHVVDFWALSRCSMSSLSLVTSEGKSTRVMAVGTDSSVRLISRVGKNLTTILPPPTISPLTQVRDVTYNRELNMMYLLIHKHELWVYYTRTNPATRLEAWSLDYIEDIHMAHSLDHSIKSRSSTPWTGGGTGILNNGPGGRSLNPKPGGSLPTTPRATTPWDGTTSLFRDATPHPSHERVSLTCLGMLYSPVIMQSVEGDACPDVTHFLMAGTEDGRVLFLNMFCRGMKYAQLQAHKDLIISVEHDQITNTLVTKCRSLTGIDVQFWSLPRLTLLRQITCENDITCSVRMGDLLLCGHKSGFLRLHSLANEGCDVCKKLEEDRIQEGKRPSRDHHGPINSVDGNLALEIFCSSSTDGFVRLWDKEKMLLREIVLDDTLTAVCFLNTRGDIILGFKQQLFLISHKKVYPVKEGQKKLPGQNDVTSDGDDAFETESDIYEDPSIRYESKKILQPDPTNMENYLVPFPNLQLKTAFFMEGRPPPDLEQQDQQDDLETISSLSDSLSLAPTDIYFSPHSTPRTLSLASMPAVDRKLSGPNLERQSTDLWYLPDFGDSPVSSPPRTPTPEPTPPPTPPPGSSEDEEEEGQAQKAKEEQNDKPACVEYIDPVQIKEKKKTFNIPSFTRESGRLGNVKIDSKTLRGSNGPGYAEPIARATYTRLEPKPQKPRRPPKSVTKKVKKMKDKPDDIKKEQEKEQKDPSDNSVQPDTNTDAATAVDNIIGGPGSETGSTLVAKNVINIPPPGGKAGAAAELRSGLQRDVSDISGQRVTGSGSAGLGKEQQSQFPGSMKMEGEMSKEACIQAANAGTPHDGFQELNKGDVSKHVKNAEANGQGQSGNPEDEEGNTGEDAGGGGTKHVQEEKRNLGNDGIPDYDPGLTRVVYIDPETGDTVEGSFDNMPEGAEILDIYEEGGDYDNDDPLELAGAKSEKRQKSVTFKGQHQNDKSAQKSWGSRTQPKGPNFASDARRYQKGMGQFGRSSVVPLSDPNLQGDLITGSPSRNRDFSPLTIFALARNRKESTAKLSRSGKGPRKDDPNYSTYSVSEGGNLFIDNNQYNKLVAQRSPSVHEETIRALSRTSASGSEMPESSKKPEGDVMKWCIQALRKSHQQLFFPPKPNRPGSSQSYTTASPRHRKDGDTLFHDVIAHTKRPNTAESIQTAGSKDEFDVYPYQSTTQQPNTSRDRIAMRDVRVKTAPTGRRSSRGSDYDQEDAYREMHASIESFGNRDYDMNEIYRPQSVGGRPLSSLDFPSIDIEDYSGNWQEIALERARLLKQQRVERQKSAKEKRQTMGNEQKERWKKTGHFECSQDNNPKPEKSIEFITPPTLPIATPTPPDNIPKELREQELSSHHPYRIRIQPRHGSASLTRTARSLINLMSSEHDVADIAGVMPKPVSAASIPSKCSRYVLVPEKPPIKQPKPTALEETLLLTRFPNQPLPSLRRHSGRVHRPRSTPDVHLEY